MSNLLQAGDIIELDRTHKVYTLVPKHMIYENCKGDFELVKHNVDLDDIDFSYLRGKYLVTKTEMTGGGTGHGPHDVYPDGHHVTCERLDSNAEVSFYQSGCFNVVNTDVKVLGKAIQKWVIPSNI